MPLITHANARELAAKALIARRLTASGSVTWTSALPLISNSQAAVLPVGGTGENLTRARGCEPGSAAQDSSFDAAVFVVFGVGLKAPGNGLFRWIRTRSWQDSQAFVKEQMAEASSREMFNLPRFLSESLSAMVASNAKSCMSYACFRPLLTLMGQ